MADADLTGRDFDRWHVERRSDRKSKSGAAYWVCRCKCGNVKDVFGSSLLKRASRSCGCLGIPGRRKPGRETPEYLVWKSMRQRCLNSRCPAYPHYGGRGITICGRWSRFEPFYADMGPRPSRSHTIERVDNNGPYAPGNCRWALRAEQANNKRSNRRFTHDGKTLNMKQWSRESGVPYHALRYHLVLAGRSVADALSAYKAGQRASQIKE